MGFYRTSSQFTEFVVKHSKTPDVVLDQVEQAIDWIASQEQFGDLTSAELSTFHAATNPIITDEEIRDNINAPESVKNSVINKAYNILKEYGFLRGTGKVDNRTSKLVESFFKTRVPLIEKATPPIRVRNRVRQEVPDIEIANLKRPTRFDRIEDRLLSQISRQEDLGREPLAKSKAAALYSLLTKAGLLEPVPSLKERSDRLTERTFKWAKLL